MDITPFTVDLPADVLADLDERLARTRWPNERGDGIPGTGVSVSAMKELVAHWRDGYDWTAQRDALNAVPHVLADGRLHAVHQRSAAEDAVPLLLLHGWADSFVRFRHVLAPLADAGAEVPFHVVVPSLPGFDFSAEPEGDLSAEAIAADLAELMTALGHDRFVVHGGDWGGVVAQEVARAFPERVIGLHLVDLPFPNIFMVDRDEASDDEKAFFARVDAWSEKDGAYVSVQSSKPLMLSYALSDSPVGLAAWLIDHFDRLATHPVDRDDLLTNVLLYWATDSIRSSIRLYSEGSAWEDEGTDAAAWGDDAGGAEASAWGGDAEGASEWGDGAAEWSMRIEVPTAMMAFPADIAPAPRELAERFYDLRRYTAAPEGGHFAALEIPQVVVDDIRAFVADLR